MERAPLIVGTVSQTEATIFLVEHVRVQRRPVPLGMVVMDKYLCATKTTFAELYDPVLRLTIVGHYHTALCHTATYVCPMKSPLEASK